MKPATKVGGLKVATLYSIVPDDVITSSVASSAEKVAD
jgi:hypothetical protein